MSTCMTTILYLGRNVDISLVEEEANLFVEKISHVVENSSVAPSCCLLQQECSQSSHRFSKVNKLVKYSLTHEVCSPPMSEHYQSQYNNASFQWAKYEFRNSDEIILLR